MEIQRASPPTYVAHNPADLDFPSVPRTAVTHAHVQADITLPDLKTILSPDFQSAESSSSRGRHGSPSSVRSLPRIDPGQSFGNGNGSRTSAEAAMASPPGSVIGAEDRAVRSASVLSMDDPDVRAAAEALSGLGNPAFARSPPSTNRSHAIPTQTNSADADSEPLLQLFTKAHPWVGGTINGSLSAYSTTKNYSPRLVQYGANLVERNITTPVVSTVSSVGRMTGVESGLRWYYGGNSRRPDDLEEGAHDVTSKRRRLLDDDMDVESSYRSSASRLRDDSLDSRSDSLPSYQGSKPPSYREEVSPPGSDRQLDRPNNGQSWSSQVFVMTSGLGVALNATSRRSLRWCLGFLGQSAERVSTLMEALKLVLEQYDQARDEWHQNHDMLTEKGERPRTPEHDESARRLAGLLKKHSDEIWHTLQNVVNSVSNYAGGALPDNARQFVRNQLMSLPQRWRFVSDNHTEDSETSRSAHRMIAFATEGLDMMSQVSQTMKLTLESAERWLERAGRNRALADSAYAQAKDQVMEDAQPRSMDLEKQ